MFEALLSESDAKAAWLRQRLGKLTSSRMCDAMAFTKGTKNNPPEPTAKRMQLMRELCAERAEANDSIRHYVSDAMQWGSDTEPAARAWYEDETGALVNWRPYRFTDHPEIDMLGASDDGLVAHDGMIECKCPTTPTFIEWIAAGVVPESHKPQMIIELSCTGRVWCDFVAFDPRVRHGPRGRIWRYQPTPEEYSSTIAAAVQFLRELDEMFYRFTHG